MSNFVCCRDCTGERSVANSRLRGFAVPDDVSAKYFVGELIGVGATAVVHACELRTFKASMLPRWIIGGSFGDELCVKVIKKRKFAAEVVLEQLRVEVTALKMLSKHPSILQVLDDYENDFVLCIVMERALGGELFEQLVSHGRLTEKTAATLVSQIAGGLEHCHAHNVIHRDLKPENLLLARPNDLSSGVKIADFGLAAISGDNSAKTFVGTPGYLAPEIRRRRGTYDSKVDVWSLGVIMYIMLSGSMPFSQVISMPEPDEKRGRRKKKKDRNLKESSSSGSSNSDLGTEEHKEEPVMKKRLPQRPNSDRASFKAAVWRTISDLAVDLIEGCLIIQPGLRLSATDIVTHPWVVNKGGSQRILSTSKLSKFVSRRDEPGHNSSFFLEPNTMSVLSSAAEKMQKAFRPSSGGPRQFSERRYHTPDHSPTRSFNEMLTDPSGGEKTKKSADWKRLYAKDLTFSIATKRSLERMASKGSSRTESDSVTDDSSRTDSLQADVTVRTSSLQPRSSSVDVPSSLQEEMNSTHPTSDPE